MSKQDKYLHNSSGYSNFKRSTEKRKKYFKDKSKKGSQYWGKKILTILTPFPPLNIRFRCACVLKNLMVLNISHYTVKVISIFTTTGVNVISFKIYMSSLQLEPVSCGGRKTFPRASLKRSFFSFFSFFVKIYITVTDYLIVDNLVSCSEDLISC